eukprot:TRINITY_DN10597_c0_g1_i4.p1 TRINITY_DN10597_c0_g1~~TRINITY_DN10597_c0_g1_i4.p1  ORF type:complete len:140 (-),score=17.95 TRINITY_DN10597_c0_g1_i4:587-1006(-)
MLENVRDHAWAGSCELDHLLQRAHRLITAMLLMCAKGIFKACPPDFGLARSVPSLVESVSSSSLASPSRVSFFRERSTKNSATDARSSSVELAMAFVPMNLTGMSRNSSDMALVPLGVVCSIKQALQVQWAASIPAAVK